MKHGDYRSSRRRDPEYAQVEERLKRSELPFSAVCTSTLEMGIDIGDVLSIDAIGAPFSVAALRQRLGRSGRRTGRSTLRLYVAEPDDPGDRVLDGLRPALAQSVAMLELLVGGWCWGSPWPGDGGSNDTLAAGFDLAWHERVPGSVGRQRLDRVWRRACRRR